MGMLLKASHIYIYNLKKLVIYTIPGKTSNIHRECGIPTAVLSAKFKIVFCLVKFRSENHKDYEKKCLSSAYVYKLHDPQGPYYSE